MKIITVTSSYAPADIAPVYKALKALEDAARKMDGCLEYQICPSYAQDGTIFIFQAWANEAAFMAYSASDDFMQMGTSIRPMMTGTPETIVYDAERNA